MIRPLLYDVKRTITSKTVLILVGIILLISLAIIPLTSTGTYSNFSEFPVVYYHDAAGYHFLVYVFNQYGDPLTGVPISATLNGNNNTYTGEAVTNSSGMVAVVVNTPPGSYTASVTETVGSVSSSSGGYLGSTPAGNIDSFSSTISKVVDRSNSSRNDVQVFWAGNYGKVPSGYSFYYKYVNSSSITYGSKPYPFNETQMILLGNLNGYHEIFDPSLPSGKNEQGMVWFELFNQTGIAVTWNEFSLVELRPLPQPINTSFVASLFFSTVLSYIVPLMAIIGSYSSYGKDRLTGVLESILARPVTRLGLGVSRFLTTIVAFSLAVIACVGVVNLLLFRYAGSFLPADYASAIMSGLVVEVAAFTGLIFLLSHVLKSTGLLLGLSIVFYLVLVFFWSIIIFLITFLLGGNLGSAVAIQATLTSFYANPAQFLSLVNVYFLQSASGIPIQASNYGVTLPAIVADGTLWAVVPFIIFLYLAVKRD